MSVRGVAYSLGACLVAGFVGAVTLVTVNQQRNPAVSLLVGTPPGGEARASLAFQLFQVAAAKQPTTPYAELVTKREVAMARAAYAREPLSTTALSLIALGTEKGGQPDLARKLFQRTAGLSRRSALVNAWLVQDYARRDLQDQTMRSLSHLVKTAPETQDIYIPMLASGLERPSSVDAMVPLLGTGPSWSNRFWREVAARPAAHGNAALLRERIMAKPWGQTRVTDTDRELLAQMIVSGHIAEAARLANRLRGSTGPATAGVIRNGDFKTRSVLTPFDWQTFSNGDLGGDLDTAGSVLSISALPETGGVVARQLVALEPGSYRLSWRVAGAPPASGALRTRLSCAAKDAEGSAARSVDIVKAKGTQDIRIDGGCRWFWLDLSVVPSSPDEGFDMQLDAISLTRIAQTAK